MKYRLANNQPVKRRPAKSRLIQHLSFSRLITGITFPGFITLMCYCAEVFPSVYDLSVDDLHWQNEEKKYFSCRLEQSVPLFGTFAIQASAGHLLTIELLSSLFVNRPHDAQLALQPAPWGRFDHAPRNRRQPLILPITETKLLSGIHRNGIRINVALTPREFLQMLNSHSRLHVAVTNEHTNHSPYKVEVNLPTTGLLPAMKTTAECINRLLPRSFEQLKEYNLYYSAGQKAPNDIQRQWIADTARYLAVDDTIDEITIDGHSDGTSFSRISPTLSRLKNLELSEERALNVSQQLRQYLVEAGVVRDIKVVVRHHGQRYPIADNATSQGRTLNRRVEIALKRAPAAPSTDTHSANDKKIES